MKSVFVAAMLLTVSAYAQTAEQPYAGQEQREIKALSQEEVRSYMQGAGMGLAKAAELNGYPGPMHVLELAEPLGLSATQRENLQRLMDAHKAEARMLGAEVVKRERLLDQLFAARQATPQAIDKALADLSAVQAKLRGAHLKAHLATAERLSAEQIRKYAALRGYNTGAGQGAKAHSGGHSGHH